MLTSLRTTFFGIEKGEVKQCRILTSSPEFELEIQNCFIMN